MSHGKNENSQELHWELFKVGLTIPVKDQLTYCVGIGAGPSEGEFREWLHRRIIVSQISFLWAQVEPLQWTEGRDLERQLHLLAYASQWSSQRQVFWSSQDSDAHPGVSERFLQSLSSGEVPTPQAGCALLLAGKAVADMKLRSTPAVPAPAPLHAGTSKPPTSHPSGVPAKSVNPPLPWPALMLALLGTVRRRLSFLWMW